MFFFKKFRPPQNNMPVCLLSQSLKYHVMKILLNHLLLTLCNLIIQEEKESWAAILNIYLDWDCVNELG